jgi:cobalt/nickel transport system ATP-binding protein
MELRDVDFTYPDGPPVLRGISFHVEHGESVGLVGANGAGKSTVLLLLNGCLLPAGGEVRFDDECLTPANLARIRGRLGTVFQDPDDQLFMPTVEEDVAFGPRNQGLMESETERRVTSSLAQMNIAHLRRRPPHRLSGGEKRAAALAGVLAMEPDALLLDEPSSGLDPRARRRLVEWLRGFSRAKIIASHDMDLVLELCPRVILLDAGQIAADGSATKIFSDESLLRRCGLEKPPSR